VTVNLSSPRAKPRWLILAFLVLGASAFGISLASAHAGAPTPIPARYSGGTQVDIDPAPGPAVNDVPGQVDMTQMGRDTSANPDVRVFWNWDSISSWAGNGQTGDACALFDKTETPVDDAFIDYVICARVANTGTPGPVVILPASANHPAYLFDCSNKKNDRCTNPVPRAYTGGQVTAGPLTEAGSLSQAGTGDLVAHNDPFDASFANGPGESYPHDSSIEILVDGTGTDSLVPAGVRLANVCSYPSAGNGGNNNPFDCVVTPGIQYGTLIVKKLVVNDNGGSKAATDFGFQVNGGTTTSFIQDPNDANTLKGQNTLTLQVGTYTVTEPAVTGYTTSTSNCTSVSVTAGGTATCTITNNDKAPSLTLVKNVTNNNGGTAVPGDWTLTATNYDSSSPDAGTYNLSESGPSGYTKVKINCSDSGTTDVSSVTLSLDESVTCTFYNDDNAPSLTLVKNVTNDNGGTAVASDWTLTATNYDSSSPDAGTYNLSESGPSGYTQTKINCSDSGTTDVSSVTLSLDESVTCTFYNDDNAASPQIGTTMSWVLHDSSSMTGFLAGGGPSTVTFSLYKDTATKTSCEPETLVDSETVDVDDLTGNAATEDGILVEEPGTYRWIASFSGNTFNSGDSSACGDEVTTISE
jgi:hypothetical protein